MDYVVVYIQVFEALKRMDPKYDSGMRFLIAHKVAVNADKIEAEKIPELGPAMVALIEDMDAMTAIIDIMDRKDAEVRMMAARLPPYSYIGRRDQGRIEVLVIEESFVDDLRNLSNEELSGRLNSADKKVRGRQAADMLCVNALVNRVLKATPFRKELRILKLNLIVEEFFRSTENLEEARAKAQDFLNTRLRSLYPDITDEETAEIQQRGADIIEAVEQKITKEREEKAAAEGGQKESGGDGGGGDADELSADEERKGVQIRRVEVRIAGRVRNIPYKIMADPDDASKFIIVQRDPETGDMVPARRRGAKRFVERNKEGRWQLS